MIGITIDGIAVGDTAEITRVAAEDDIASFVEAVGDHNPIHSDRAYAAGTAFGARIAPGIWTAGLISAVIGTRLPGPGTVYLSQDLKFLRPVLLGDIIAARVEVIDVNRERNRVRMRTVCANQRGEPVLTGEALVRPSPVPVSYRAPGSGHGLLTLWALHPWAWVTQTLVLWGVLGLSAWTLVAPRPGAPRG